MKSALVIGSSSTAGRAVGESLDGDYSVSYAGRTDAGLTLDLSRVDLSPYEGRVFDLVIHAASDFGGPGGEDMRRAEITNAVGTLDVCRLAGVVQAKHLVVLSSFSASYSPQDPLYNIYALSKRHGEELAALYAKDQDFTLTILRPTQLYDAPGRCREHQPFLYSMIDNARAGKDIAIYGSNDARRNLLFLPDLVRIIGEVIEARLGGVFDCASPQSLRLTEIAGAAYAAFDQSGSVVFKWDESDIPDLPEPRDFRLYELIHYSPQTSFADGLAAIKRESGT